MDDRWDKVDLFNDLPEMLYHIEVPASEIEDANHSAAIQRDLFIAKEIVADIRAEKIC